MVDVLVPNNYAVSLTRYKPALMYRLITQDTWHHNIKVGRGIVVTWRQGRVKGEVVFRRGNIIHVLGTYTEDPLVLYVP